MIPTYNGKFGSKADPMLEKTSFEYILSVTAVLEEEAAAAMVTPKSSLSLLTFAAL